MALEDDLRNLSRVPFFAALEPDARRLIAFSAETRIMRAGDVLFRKGELSDGAYVLMQGSITLDAQDNGGSDVEVSLPYSLIGELALISDVLRPVTAVARQPTTVLKIQRRLFHRVLNEYPSSAMALRQMIETRLGDFAQHLDRLREDWETRLNQ
jgi:CRP-like cAMP-binding protein